MFNSLKNIAGKTAETVLARPLEWAVEPYNAWASAGRMSVVVAGWCAAIVSPLLVWAHFNAQNLEDDVKAIDNGKSSIFTSIDD